ncbi:aldo/keto reductase [Ramlibacter solisilvae]|uniref:NADP-dependent oxidoreductase domain-containing protein n=1 Tax=Ramlibacter tataouinensis TaxID=94132 RepID=A0A127JQ88_9BURK|nr:aldo/keto reductase [Ramlibacter tataouinensis]AMO22085.1 hypothetical protein UC35_03315 [Ramlibacter tataouinensis]
MQQLVLGTAQFGLDYGVTNARGRVPETETAQLLDQAWAGGVRLLDTARAYGDSEQVLGSLLPATGRAWRVITKTLPLRSGQVDRAGVAAVDAAFAESLQRLGQSQVDALLVHQAQDLLVPGGDALYAWMREQKQRGLARRIGASVYDGQEIAALLDRFELDVVQLPSNIADQRLLQDGSAQRLHAAGVEIHVRSLFLQGVLLAPAAFAADRFGAQAAWLVDFHRECVQRGVTPQQACLGYFRHHAQFSAAVVGVSHPGELGELLAAWDGAPSMDWSGWAVDNTAFTDPRLWKPRS